MSSELSHVNLFFPSTPDDFKDVLKQSSEEGKVVVVDFFTSWCGPCKRIAPEFKRIADAMPGVNFVKFQCDGDEDRDEFARDIGINCFPTFRFYWDGDYDDQYCIRGSDISKVEKYARHLHEALSALDAREAKLDPEFWGNDRTALRNNEDFVKRVQMTEYRKLVYPPNPSWAEFLEDVRQMV